MGTRLPVGDVDDPRRPARAQASAAAVPAPDLRGSLSEGAVLALQQRAGNQATRAYLARDETTAAAEPATAAEPGAPELSPETKKAEPEHPAAPKLGMDLASGEKVLTNAFGKVKTIVQGKLELLAPAAFQAAYDKIYGKTKWSWEKYVVPTYGTLNGFAHDGTSYVNSGSAGLHTVVHEMLHNNTAADWTDVVGPGFNEGTTEVMTQDACAKLSVDAPTTYPGESPVVRAVMAAGLSYDTIAGAYLAGGAKAKVADWVDANCKETWAVLKGHMDAKDWAAAKASAAKKS